MVKIKLRLLLLRRRRQENWWSLEDVNKTYEYLLYLKHKHDEYLPLFAKNDPENEEDYYDVTVAEDD